MARLLSSLVPYYILLSSTSLIPTLALSTISSIFELPGHHPTSWFENLAVRPNGLILATRGDVPEIWQIDPATGSGSMLVSVAETFNLTGIAQVGQSNAHNHVLGGGSGHGHPETYVFGSSHIPAPFTITPGSAKVWTLKFNTSSPTPMVSLLAALPTAGFINGIAAWGSNVLLGDTVNETIYFMDVDTGSFTTPMTGMVGINGVQTAKDYVYWASHSNLTLNRFPIGSNAVPTGPAEVLVTGQLIDDFAIDVNGANMGEAYLGAMYDNEVVEAIIPMAPSTTLGATSVVAGPLTGAGGLCTVVVFGRQPADCGLLYATVGQGGGNAAIVAIDPNE